MSEDVMLMEMPGAFEREQYGLTHPDVVRVGNAQNNGRQRHSIPLGVVLTGYRLLTTIVIVGIGIPKAVYSYHGQPLISPSLDWVGGIIFTLLFFWLGVIEATRPELCPSFFQVDLAPAILGFLNCDDTPSPLDPSTLGSLRHDNTLPLVPSTLGSPRHGDTLPLAPLNLGSSRRGDTLPLAPSTLGSLRRGDTLPLAPLTLGSSRRGDTLPLTPPTLGSLRRSDALPLAPPTFGSPCHGDTSSPLTPEIPGDLVYGVLGCDDPSPRLAPETLGGLRDIPPYPGFPAYISRQPARPPPTLSFPVPSMLVNTRPATSARPMSSSVQLAGTTPNRQNITAAMPSSNLLPSSLALQGGGPQPFTQSQSHYQGMGRTSGYSFEPITAARTRRAPPRETAQASAYPAPPNPPDVPYGLSGHMSPRHNVEHFGGSPYERHKSEGESYARRGHRPPQETAQASAFPAPPNPPDVPYGLSGHMSPRHNVEHFEGSRSERHKSDRERDHSYSRR